jgi:hypothetical protein
VYNISVSPINPIAGNPESLNQNPIPRDASDNHWVSILAIAIFVLLALGVVAFLYYQNQQLKSMLASYQTQAIPAAVTPSPTPNPEMPIVSTPSANMKIVSPLKVTGIVPAGWMFEGIFPIKLVDANQKLIIQGQAKETVAGSWQSGNPVDFTATLTFKTSSASGFLILQNDNPSGIPANSKTFQVPVVFQSATGYTCPVGGFVDCMPATSVKPECSTDAMNWYKANCPGFKGVAY